MVWAGRSISNLQPNQSSDRKTLYGQLEIQLKWYPRKRVIQQPYALKSCLKKIRLHFSIGIFLHTILRHKEVELPPLKRGSLGYRLSCISNFKLTIQSFLIGALVWLQIAHTMSHRTYFRYLFILIEKCAKIKKSPIQCQSICERVIHFIEKLKIKNWTI